MKPTNRKKQARPQIRRERRESTINATVQRKKLEKGTKWGGVGGRRKRHQLRKHKPSLPAHPQRGKEKKGRKERGRGWVGKK